jgi:protein-L-isoaspartate O-methyltransferase
MADASLSPSKPTQQFATAAASELATLKTRQQSAWSSGDPAVVGTTLQIADEQMCEALDLRPGRKVLDVAAGNGIAAR